jgi:hypothetical protein
VADVARVVCAACALRAPVAPAADRSSSATSSLELGAGAPVAGWARELIPAGAVIAARPLCANVPTRSAPGTLVVSDGLAIHLEFLLTCPPLLSIG